MVDEFEFIKTFLPATLFTSSYLPKCMPTAGSYWYYNKSKGRTAIAMAAVLVVPINLSRQQRRLDASMFSNRICC